MTLDTSRTTKADGPSEDAARRQELPMWARIVFVLATLAPIWRLAHLIHVYAIPVPFMDEWALARLMVDAQRHVLIFGDLWLQHNEHRMLFPNLVFVGLAQFGGWSVTRECWVSLAVTICSFCLIADLARRTVGVRMVYPLCLVLSWLMFSPMQWENFIIGFQLQWPLTILAFVFCMWSLAVWRGRRLGLACAIIGATLASFSMAGGLMAWFVGMAYLLLASTSVPHPSAPGKAEQERSEPTPTPSLKGRESEPTAPRASGWRPVHQIIWAVAAAACFAVFMHGSNFGADGVGHGYWRRHPDVLANYIAYYLGSPVLYVDSWLRSVAGLAGIAAYIYVAFAWLKLRRTGTDEAGDSAIVWLMIGAFGILDAVTTGIGRSSFSAVQGGTSRYLTIANTLWIGLIGAACTVRRHGARKSPLPAGSLYAIAAICAAATFVFFHWSVAYGYQQVAQTTRICRRGIASLPSYRTAPDADLRLLYPDPAALRQMCAMLDHSHIRPFDHR
jgi:hypothetical protein